MCSQGRLSLPLSQVSAISVAHAERTSGPPPTFPRRPCRTDLPPPTTPKESDMIASSALAPRVPPTQTPSTPIQPGPRTISAWRPFPAPTPLLPRDSAARPCLNVKSGRKRKWRPRPTLTDPVGRPSWSPWLLAVASGSASCLCLCFPSRGGGPGIRVPGGVRDPAPHATMSLVPVGLATPWTRPGIHAGDRDAESTTTRTTPCGGGAHAQ
jgi:hypothetical protein